MLGEDKELEEGASKRRILFPRIGTKDEALSASRQGSYAAAWGAFSAMFTVIAVQFFGEEPVIGESFRNPELRLYLIVFEALLAVVFLFCVFSIWKSASLVSAVITFVLILAEVVVRIVDLDINAFSWVWGWALLSAYNGIRGARAFKQYRQLSPGAD